jgi:hydrogenase maturation factor HypE
VKKVVDTEIRNFEEMKLGVLNAAEAAIKKKKRVLTDLIYKKKEF